ncbi:pteridine-dependent deoxygenase [Dokdonella soli]|uniref:Pteridine-dependent deoxygenase n=2 Tax=Dokdonella soli TaxID=529810 RepID=A0ABN1IGJ8_9GAMM
MTEPEPLPLPLGIGYERTPASELLGQADVLAVIGFGASAALPDDLRALRVGLEPLDASLLEVWRASAPVQTGRAGDLRWSSDGEHLFFAIEVDEATHGGITGAAEHAYRTLAAFVAASATPHLLRLWNYLDAINLGEGDAERYRQFCDGRARGMGAHPDTRYPAATAIGRQDGVRVLQVYGLAARHAGVPVENPRQVSAWRYPRQYGPTAPTFARGMLTATSQLLISGTAAVVGHASQHHDDLVAQIDETLANLASLLQRIDVDPSRFAAHSFLKAYLRDPADASLVAQALYAHLPSLGGLLLLAGDICRSELLVEIDGVHRNAD